MKFKVFTHSIQSALEETVNEWLKAHWVSIEHCAFTSDVVADNPMYTLILFYTERGRASGSII